MDDTTQSRMQPSPVGRLAVIVAVAWTAVIAVLLGWSLQQSGRQAEELARLEAVASFNKDDVYRRWVASHGGVYVPVTAATPPNPYLAHIKERDVTTPSGRVLTLVNPEYMTRQALALGREQYGTQGHITSLNPLRPENAPDPWESQALHAFDRGETEVTAVEMLGGELYLRLMRPLVTEESCLACHAEQGYKVGDIRGGISVSVPMAPFNAIEREHTLPLELGHGLIWLLGLIGISLGMWRLGGHIREREQYEKALDDSRLQMELALRGADLGTWDWNVPTGRMMYNERWAQMLGYALQELEPHVRVWKRLVHPDDMPRVEEILNAHLDGKTDSYESEHRLKHKSCEWVWVLDKGRVIERDSSGNPLRVCGTHLDITERKRMQVVLEERLAQLTVLLESMQRGVLVEDANRRILYANREFCDLFGTPAPDAVAGTDCVEASRAAAPLFRDSESFLQSIERHLTGGKVVRNELLEMADGRILDRTYAPILRDNQLFGHLWLYRDKTDQIRMERDYRTLFREMLGGFVVHEIICDKEGLPVDYRFLDFNPAFEHMTGLDRDIIGKTVLEVLPDTGRYWIDVYGRVPLTGEPATFAHYSAEISKHFEVTAFCPAPKQLACIFIDVTEQKREERVRAALLRLSEFSTGHDVSELLQQFLDEAEALTGSAIGFYHFIEENQETLSLQAWSTNTLSNTCTAEGKGRHYPVSEAGIWVDCILVRGPVIHNDYASLSHKKGVPEGHAPVIRELVVPVLRGNAIVAILGVGNKPSDYNDEDVETVQRLANLAWETVIRKQAEEALRKSETMMRSIFQVSPIGIGLVSNRVLLDVNERLCAIVGYSRDELIGKSSRIFYLTEGEFKRVGREILRQCDLGGPSTLVTRFKRKDETVVDIQLSAMPLNPNDIGTGITFTALDITERRRAEEDRERLMSAIEQAAEAIVITDVSGTIQYVNPAFVRITGYSREEAIGQNPRILKSGEHDDAYYRNMWDTLINGETWTGQFVNKKKDGSRVIEQAIISPVRDATGRTVNYVAVKRDVTEELGLEEQYRQAQKMEFVGRLAGGVAHDFNNMLGVILGHVELALELLRDDHPAREDLIEIDKAAQRSADLTRQLLAFARKQTVSPEALDLNKAVTGMLKMLQRLIGENIELVWQPSPDVWPVWIDPSQIDQILANLCVNARDAIGDVGKVTVETGNVFLDALYCREQPGLTPGEYVRLRVSDTGNGMDEETVAHAFEPFFTTKPMGQGTGLGLATVYGIVKQNNGYIDVQSERHRGTTFTIYLPRHTKLINQPAEDMAVPRDVGGPETILLVEDQPALMRMATAMLEGLGYRVLAAATPGNAIALAETHANNVQLLLTDVIMPEMNGRDLAARLLIHQPSLKCLFMSGYTVDVISHHGVLDAGVCFIQKPFSRLGLAAKVREALTGQGTGMP